MTDEHARFDDGHVAVAERLDGEITAALAGGPSARTDPVALWLVTAMRPTVPRDLRRAVADTVSAPARRAWRWVRLCAAALAVVLATQGLGGLISGEWVAENLDEPFGSHAFTEGGLALLAASVAVAAGALRRALAPVAVAAGVPLGLILGVRGVPEIGEFAAGAALHLTEGTLALCLFAAWWWARRYRRGPDPEDVA